jgi:osmoprotectant transport system ATP-binding protein
MSDRNSPEPDTMIRLENVSKQYPLQDVRAVSGLSLSIRSGEFVVLVGPSGCGKTTTLRMINRLVEPSEGKIWIDGKDVTNVDVDVLRRGIGYVIQHVGLLPHLTVAANVELVPKMNGVSKAVRTARTAELLKLVGLDSKYGDRYPKQLSGGQQQRVGVARALAADPPIMLMDEPFAAVDPVTRRKLQDEFLSLQKRLKKTIVFVTHDIDEALRLGDRIAIFDEGCRIAQFATPLEILTNPADQFVRQFVGGGAAIKRLALLTIGDVHFEEDLPDADMGGSTIMAASTTTIQEALERILDSDSAAIAFTAVDGRHVSVGLQQLLLAAARPGNTQMAKMTP